MAKIISIINQKGGVGKTTTAINLGASLAVAEHKTLIVDFDPQGNASSGLGIDVSQYQTKTVYQCLAEQMAISEILVATELPDLFVAPSDCNLSGAEVELVSELAREHRLRNVLAEVRDRFDHILIDCPPSLGLLTINALTASDSYLVPMQCEYFALEGLSQLQSTVKLIQQALNPKLHLEGILLTMYDSRNNLAKQVQQEVKNHFGEKVFETVIPRNVRLSEAPSHGKPALLYDIESKGSISYLSVAKEIINHHVVERNKALGITVIPAGAALPSQANPNVSAPVAAPVSTTLASATVSPPQSPAISPTPAQNPSNPSAEHGAQPSNSSF